MTRLLIVTAGVFSLAALLFAAGLGQAQNKDDPELQKQTEQLNKDLQGFSEDMQRTLRDLRQQLSYPGPVPIPLSNNENRLGLMVHKPGTVLVDQMGLKAGQGLVVAGLFPDAAAGKAGLKVNDILWQFGGKDVPSDTKVFGQMVSEVKADEAVDVVVLRKGKQETIKNVKVPAAKAMR